MTGCTCMTVSPPSKSRSVLGFPFFSGENLPLLRSLDQTEISSDRQLPRPSSSPPVTGPVSRAHSRADARSPRRVAGQPAPAAETKENKPAKRLSRRGLATYLCAPPTPLLHHSPTPPVPPSHQTDPSQNPPPPPLAGVLGVLIA
jgi:hypothetical protein